MKMNSVEIAVLDGEILIIQNDPEDNCIRLTSDQADLVCEWIKGAAQNIIDGSLRPDYEQE